MNACAHVRVVLGSLISGLAGMPIIVSACAGGRSADLTVLAGCGESRSSLHVTTTDCGVCAAVRLLVVERLLCCRPVPPVTIMPGSLLTTLSVTSWTGDVNRVG